MPGEARGFPTCPSAPKSIGGPLVFLFDRRRRRHRKTPIPIRSETKATDPTATPTIAPVLIGAVVGLESEISESLVCPWLYIRL